MPTYNVPKTDATNLQFQLDPGQVLFVVGPNGSGKSSLMHRFYNLHTHASRRITAHRQTWFESGAINMSPQQRRQYGDNFGAYDAQPDARWKEQMPAQRATIAIYDLLDAENIRARGIAKAMDEKNVTKATELSGVKSAISTINTLLDLAGMKIVLSVQANEEVVASKNGSAPYSIAELSDGERNAILIGGSVLTAKPSTSLLIDEPERHLHRSIISPFLTALFAQRSDCAFIVSTHDLDLPLDNPAARVLLIRGCEFQGTRPDRWDLDLLGANAPVDDATKRAMLGARRKVLFVEGEAKSLDKILYEIVFPNASIVPKGGCKGVEDAVAGVRGAQDLHWVGAFGLVDSDRRTPQEVIALRDRGVYSLAVYSVESIYYHPTIQTAIATRQAQVVGGNPATVVADATTQAIARIAPNETRIAALAIEKVVQETIDRQRPTQAQIAAGVAVNIQIDVATLLTAERAALAQLLAANDLTAIISRYSVRETGALGQIANRLGFKSRDQYEKSVRKLLVEDAGALTFVRGLCGTLAADLVA